jgi:hypothetical protein
MQAEGVQKSGRYKALRIKGLLTVFIERFVFLIFDPDAAFAANRFLLLDKFF